MQIPIDEIIDRYTIFLLKKENIGGKEIEKAVDTYWVEVKMIGIMTEFKIDIWMTKLYEINKKIWNLEAELRAGKITDLKEIGRRALKIREANKERIRIKNSIVEATGTGFKDIKINHVSE